jgi:serine/threonine protein kinase
MLTTIEYIHRKGFIFRDIKPENFLIGKDGARTHIFLIDFGLAKRYIDKETGNHIEQSDECTTRVGTARYCSARALLGQEQSRRDDMEALLYLWLYLLRGTLPWVGIDEQDFYKKCDKISKRKAAISPEVLCANLPSEFARYFRLVKALGFKDEPDYAGYRAIFRKLFMRYGFIFDYEYSWIKKGDPTTALSKEKRPQFNTRLFRDPVLNGHLKIPIQLEVAPGPSKTLSRSSTYDALKIEKYLGSVTGRTEKYRKVSIDPRPAQIDAIQTKRRDSSVGDLTKRGVRWGLRSSFAQVRQISAASGEEAEELEMQ